MNPSLFLALVQAYFPGLVLRVVEKYNGQNSPQTYFYRQYLRKVFSVDGKWGTLSVNNSLVAADIVAMDSALPLKKRPSMGQYSGDVPKMGLEFSLNEKELTDLQSLIARLNYNGSATEAQIVAKLMRDVDGCIGGIYERMEAMFLQAISYGVTVVDDSETVGTAIRLDYKLPAANQTGAMYSWDEVSNAKPLTDLQRKIDFATSEGNVITAMLMDRPTFNNFAATDQVRQAYAAAAGFFGASIPVPTLEQVNMTLQKKYGVELRIVDRTVRIQRNGANVAFKPWKPGAVAFITTDQLGSYVWARLAEMDFPVTGVEYQTADDFILVSKFNENRPSLKEVTNSAARVVPVLDNIASIYLLDTTVDNG